MCTSAALSMLSTDSRIEFKPAPPPWIEPIEVSMSAKLCATGASRLYCQPERATTHHITVGETVQGTGGATEAFRTTHRRAHTHTHAHVHVPDAIYRSHPRIPRWARASLCQGARQRGASRVSLDSILASSWALVLGAHSLGAHSLIGLGD